MANFVLIYTGGRMPETDAERALAMTAWNGWFGSLGDRVVDGGNPFGPGAKHVNSSGSVGDGAIGTQAGGYSILKADSLDDAVAAAKGCPVLQGGGDITVYEVFPVI